MDAHVPFTEEPECDMQAQAAGSGSDLFTLLFLIKPNLSSDLH